LGFFKENPAYGLLKKILPPKKKRVQSEPDPFTAQDRDKMLKAAWEKLPEPLALVLEVMAMSGLRLGEALAMRAENLDISNKLYLVTETARQGRFGPPKSGERLVDLDAILVEKLRAYIKKLRRENLGRSGETYLFPHLTQRMVQRGLERACTAARLRRRNPHDLRHTFAPTLLVQHISPAYIQRQLGHHSISQTVDTYGKWLPGQGREQLDQALRGAALLRSQVRVRDGENP
jgi:integrase